MKSIIGKIWENLFPSEQEEERSTRRASSYKKIIDDVCVGQHDGLNVFFSVREENENYLWIEIECGGMVNSFRPERFFVSMAGAGVLSHIDCDMLYVLDETMFKKIDKILDEYGLVDRKRRLKLPKFTTNPELLWERVDEIYQERVYQNFEKINKKKLKENKGHKKHINRNEEYIIYDEELTKHVIVGKRLINEHKISGGEAIEKYISIYELANNRFVFVFYIPYSQSTIVKSASKTDLAKNRGAFYFEHINHNYKNVHFVRINALLASLGICDDSTWKKEVVWK